MLRGRKVTMRSPTPHSPPAGHGAVEAAHPMGLATEDVGTVMGHTKAELLLQNRLQQQCSSSNAS
jgi:hypothetical protein